jgi:hypothetical protein
MDGNLRYISCTLQNQNKVRATTLEGEALMKERFQFERTHGGQHPKQSDYEYRFEFFKQYQVAFGPKEEVYMD